MKQYGHEAELRFVALDSMVSNGFQSWAWLSGSEHGGWAELRHHLASSPRLRRFRPDGSGAGSSRSRRWPSSSEKLERDTALDDERARDNPHGYLPGLAMRLQMQGVEGRDRRGFEQQGLEGEDLRLALPGGVRTNGRPGELHLRPRGPARHRPCASGRKMRSGGKTEYYAKLSEAVFTTDPRIAVGSIILPPASATPTPHGQANRRIMKGVVKWMKKHRDEIARAGRGAAAPAAVRPPERRADPSGLSFHGPPREVDPVGTLTCPHRLIHSSC